VVLGFVALAALVTVVSALAYLHSASGRRFLAAKVSTAVSQEFVAELRIERIDVLSHERVLISGATLFDADKRAVIHLKGVEAEFDVLTLLRSVAFEPAARIELSSVRVERLEIGLFRTKTGGLSLVQAFESKKPSPPPAKPSKGPLLRFPKVALECVALRTDLSGLEQATAELRALRLNFGWSPEQLSLGLASDEVRVVRALPVDGQARLNVQIRAPGTTQVTLEGSLGALPVQASLRETDGEVALSLSSASLTPEAMRVLVPAWPLHEPLQVRVELSGRLQAMQARVEAQAGQSQLVASGPLALDPSVKGRLSLTGRNLDARLFAPDLARSDLGLDATLEFSVEPAIRAELNARIAKGELAGVPLPGIELHALYAGNQLTASAASSDPALPVSADVVVSPQGALTGHARAQNLNLAALAPYGLRAQGQLDLEASAELVQENLVAEFEARIRDLLLAPLRAQAIVVHGKLRGPTTRLEQLALELQAEGTKIALAATEFPVWVLES
jgi:hypothetical protein